MVKGAFKGQTGSGTRAVGRTKFGWGLPTARVPDGHGRRDGRRLTEFSARDWFTFGGGCGKYGPGFFIHFGFLSHPEIRFFYGVSLNHH